MDPEAFLYAQTAVNALREEKEGEEMRILEAEKRVQELHDKLKKKRTKTRRHAHKAALEALAKLKEMKSIKMEITLRLMMAAAASFNSDTDESKKCTKECIDYKGYCDCRY